MESQPQNPEFRNNPENFHPCNRYTTDLDAERKITYLTLKVPITTAADDKF